MIEEDLFQRPGLCHQHKVADDGEHQPGQHDHQADVWGFGHFGYQETYGVAKGHSHPATAAGVVRLAREQDGYECCVEIFKWKSCT